MKTKSEHHAQKNSQSGNALIYVLIAIALFAALSFTFARQNNNESTDQLEGAKAETFAMQLIAYTAQVKSVVDQMTLSGSQITDLDFTLPSDSGFNGDPLIHKIYHPSGGGLSAFVLPKAITATDLANPPAGAYIGVFNNVEWTPTGAHDVMMSAYGISKPVCELLNKKITGDKTIPAVTGDAAAYFVDSSFHSSNSDFTISDCAACKDQLTLCVSDTAAKTFVYYTVITPR